MDTMLEGMKGRTIKLFLVTGSTTGLRSAEVLNWTGKAVASPRSQLKDLIAREEIATTGIYFLFGRDPNPPGNLKVYIGESDTVAERLKKHSNDVRWDFWENTIVVVSKDENLTKSHVAFLEHRLQTLVQQIGKAELATAVEPLKKLPESDLADMQYFETQVLMLMPVLGCDWLARQPIQSGAEMEFELVVPKTTEKARAFETEDGEFVVRSGSHARREAVGSLGQNYKDLRQSLEADGKLGTSPDGKTLVFADDVAFNSPSAAASVVTGAQTNGREAWKIDGKSYASWDADRIARVAPVECVAAVEPAETRT